MKISGRKEIKIGRVSWFIPKDKKEMTEQELEQERQHEDYVYDCMKEEQLLGRRID